MRDVFRTTITSVSGAGALTTLAGIEVTVYLADTTTLATIFQRRTGAAQGPSPEAAASGGPNPFTTGASGAVEFWLPAGVYDIQVRDTQLPARIASRGPGFPTPPIQWNSSPAAVGSLPTALLAQDAGLTLASVAADVKRQYIPIGQVIDWWRPAPSVPIPTGFEICDGHQVAAGNHDFTGVAGAINMPDLRNKFIIGADVLKNDGTGSVNGDGTALSTVQHPNAPGIGGTGGANASKNLDHQHVAPGHKHAVSDPGHGHGIWVSDPGHGHDVSTFHINPQGGAVGWGSQWGATTYTTGPPLSVVSYMGSMATSVATGKAYGAGTGINVGANNSGTGISVGPGGAPSGDAPIATTGANLSTAADMRPAHVGLLKLMKVRRA